MRNKEVVSAVVGGAFFAIPYLGMSIALAPALAIGCVAFGASELVLSGVKGKESLKDTDRELYLKITEAKKQNREILNLIPKKLMRRKQMIHHYRINMQKWKQNKMMRSLYIESILHLKKTN